MLQFPSRYMECSGLEDVFLKAGVFGPNAVTKVMDGKAYYRAVKGHMLANEAIWRLKLRYFRQWLESKEEEIRNLNMKKES